MAWPPHRRSAARRHRHLRSGLPCCRSIEFGPATHPGHPPSIRCFAVTAASAAAENGRPRLGACTRATAHRHLAPRLDEYTPTGYNYALPIWGTRLTPADVRAKATSATQDGENRHECNGQHDNRTHWRRGRRRGGPAHRGHDLRLVRAPRREGAGQGRRASTRRTSTSPPSAPPSPTTRPSSTWPTLRAAVEKAGYRVGAVASRRAVCRPAPPTAADAAAEPRRRRGSASATARSPTCKRKSLVSLAVGLVDDGADVPAARHRRCATLAPFLLIAATIVQFWAGRRLLPGRLGGGQARRHQHEHAGRRRHQRRLRLQRLRHPLAAAGRATGASRSTSTTSRRSSSSP